MRPPDLAKLILNLIGLLGPVMGWQRMLVNATGTLSPDEKSYIPETEQPKVIRVARIWTAIYAAVIGLALATQSILPLMVIGLPSIYGAWHYVLVGLLQHGGLAENVIDHRLNSRTVHINPVSRFVYWNMNYHIEHHMFPMVPYHRLPELHARIRDDLPAPTPSILAGYREMVPILLRQLGNEEVYLRRALPPTARPYREDLHEAALGGSPVPMARPAE